jgi:hypothetical protein
MYICSNATRHHLKHCRVLGESSATERDLVLIFTRELADFLFLLLCFFFSFFFGLGFLLMRASALAMQIRTRT